jgi:hypothetical protein
MYVYIYNILEQQHHSDTITTANDIPRKPSQLREMMHGGQPVSLLTKLF